MTTHKITFLPHNVSIDVEPGTSVIQAALDAGVHINASCGGEGVCGKCRVRIEEGAVADGISEKLSSEEIQKGYRLACRSAVTGDLTVRIPVESAIDAAVLNRPASPRRSARIRKFNLDELKERGLFLAPVEKKFLKKATAMDPTTGLPRWRAKSKIARKSDSDSLTVRRTLARLCASLAEITTDSLSAPLSRASVAPFKLGTRGLWIQPVRGTPARTSAASRI